MASNRLIAVTGGTGFIGKMLIPALLDAGYRVRAMARNPEKSPFKPHHNLDLFHAGLGERDDAFVEGADIVLHMAGLIKARTQAEFYTVNAHMAGDFAKAAESAQVDRFILLSSMAARQPELSHYSGSKFSGEKQVAKSFSRKLAVIRAPAVFGPGDEATKPFFQLLKRGWLPVAGGREWRERRLAMVYVHDLVRTIVDEGTTGAFDGQTVSPATIGDMGWDDFIRHCEPAVGRKIRLLPVPLAVLYPVSAVTSVTSRLFGIGHLTLGKLNEFLYDDWQSEDIVDAPTPFTKALSETLQSYSQ